MASDDQRNDQTSDPREARLRIDAVKVNMARLRLASIDRTVFSGAGKHPAEIHDRLIRQIVSGLFVDG